MTTETQVDATARLKRALVQRAIAVCNAGEIEKAAKYIEDAIGAAEHSVQTIELPSGLARGFALEWLRSAGAEVRDGNQLVIPSTVDPLAGCAEFADALKDWANDLSAAKAQQQQSPSTPQAPVRMKRRLAEPERPSKRAAATADSTGASAPDFDTDPSAQGAKGVAASADTSAAASADRRIAQLEAVEMWMRREKQYENELEEALKAVDATDNAELRALREEKANLARNNYRTAVNALKMARKEAGIGEK
jgi:hypothetical protein